jgi:hypothetical protein
VELSEVKPVTNLDPVSPVQTRLSESLAWPDEPQFKRIRSRGTYVVVVVEFVVVVFESAEKAGEKSREAKRKNTGINWW